MKATYLLMLHQKALRIIEMYNQISSRLNYAKRELIEYEKLGNQAWQKFLYTDKQDIEKRISHCKKVQERIEGYYKTTLNKINEAQ